MLYAHRETSNYVLLKIILKEQILISPQTSLSLAFVVLKLAGLLFLAREIHHYY